MSAVERLPEEPKKERPNIIIVYTDDMRDEQWQQVMPNTVSYFQKEGTTFTNGFVTTPLCCPSRASAFSGQYSHNHGVRTNTQINVHDGRSEAFDFESSIQRYLKEAGYRTAWAGKGLAPSWNLDNVPPHFDKWAVSDPRGDADGPGGGYYGLEFNINGERRVVNQYHTTFTEKMAKQFVTEFEEEGDEPWALFVWTFAPHASYVAEPKYKDAPVPDWDGNPAVDPREPAGCLDLCPDKPPWVQVGRTNQNYMPGRSAEQVRQGQLRALMSVDDLVGNVHKVATKAGGDNLLSFFVSDNGFMWGEYGMQGKLLPYRYTTEVPFLARWPGHIEAGATDDRLVANIDIAPTIMDAVGMQPDPEYPMDGQSLLSDAERDRIHLELLFYGRNVPPTWISTRTKDYQYIEWYDAGNADGIREENVIFRDYYDLESDPYQTHNLLGDGDPGNDPDVAAIAQRLRNDFRCVGSACP